MIVYRTSLLLKSIQLMELNQVLNWVVIAIVVVVVIVLFNLILGIVSWLARIAIPILIILFLVGLILRFIGTRRT